VLVNDIKFKDVVSESMHCLPQGTNMFELATMPKSLRKPLKKMNNSKFGDVHVKKGIAILRLPEIQKVL